MFLGGASGAFICGVLIDRIGRKNSLLITGLAQTIAWMIILFGSNVTMLCVARVLAGFGSGFAYVVIPVFVSEISNSK